MQAPAQPNGKGRVYPFDRFRAQAEHATAEEHRTRQRHTQLHDIFQAFGLRVKRAAWAQGVRHGFRRGWAWGITAGFAWGALVGALVTLAVKALARGV